jgi:carbon-monoxide dehydrogenase large subunit
MSYGVVLRSPHAHARITRIATDRAAAMAGVLTILTAADLDAAKIGGLPCGWGVPLGQGKKQVEPPHPVLAGPIVRHVGDPVAFVVAETREAALDAAEAIAVDYEALPHITNLEQSVAPGAPQIWPEAKNNL